LNVLLYFFGELAMDFLLRNVPFSPAILSHGPVHFSGTSIEFFLLWLSNSVLIICIRSCLPNSMVNVHHSHLREEVGESLSPLYISSLPRGPLTFGACLMPSPCLLSITGTRLKDTANGCFTKDFGDHPSISSVKHTSSINKHMQTRLSRYSPSE